MRTATEDYRLGALGGTARGCGLKLEYIERQPEAPSRQAHRPWPVVFLCSCLATAPVTLAAQVAPKVFMHADTIRGSNTPQRSWWDVSFYDLHVKVNTNDSSITGYNAISYRVLRAPPAREMQIDLQLPLVVDSIVQDGLELSARRDGNAFFVTLVSAQQRGVTKTISVYYHGKPTVAARPPWDGGFVWARDSLARNWIATANEGLGASVWWPNKDILSDEPDSQRVAITMPDSSIDVSNGRLRTATPNADGTTTYEWFVANPINNYDIAVNAAHYAHFSDEYQGEKGRLTLDFYPLDYHVDTARKQFQQVKPMLQCFESWFGPYPWYEDGYKLVETPHLGMEHQSAVAYGNHYKNGYMLHTIRQIVDDDARWRGILRGLNKTFWHQTVTGKQVEDYISRQSGMNLGKVFDEYLRTTMIPTLEYKLQGQKLSYRWNNVVRGFAMPVKVTTATNRYGWIRPTASWKTMALKLDRPEDFRVDENFYVNAKDLLKPAADSTTVRKGL